MRFLALFLLVVAYKFLTNLMHYFRIKKLQTYFSEFLEHKRSDMNLYRQEVLSLFEKAHVKDIKIPVSEHIGNRKIVSGIVSTFSMFPSTRTEFSVTVLNMFEEAEGVFRKNMLDSFIFQIYAIIENFCSEKHSAFKTFRLNNLLKHRAAFFIITGKIRTV